MEKPHSCWDITSAIMENNMTGFEELKHNYFMIH